MSVSTDTASSPSALPETVVFSWRVHRLREEPRRLGVIAAAYGIALGLWWLVFPHPLALFLPAVSLTSALAEYLFPASYRLTTRGAHVANGFARLFLDWRDVRRATVGAEGVYLSPLARADSPLAPFRGIRLRFGADNAEQVIEIVRRLRQADGSEATS